MKKSITCLLLLLVLVCHASAALAGQVVVEQQLLSVTGEPVTRELVFPGSGFADFVLKVRNGEEDGSQRISSALVSLNGTKILIPADFNQQIQTLERAISPLQGDNILAVTMRSKPGGTSLVQVFGTPTFLLPPDPGPDGDVTLEGVVFQENLCRIGNIAAISILMN